MYLEKDQPEGSFKAFNYGRLPRKTRDPEAILLSTVDWA